MRTVIYWRYFMMQIHCFQRETNTISFFGTEANAGKQPNDLTSHQASSTTHGVGFMLRDTRVGMCTTGVKNPSASQTHVTKVATEKKYTKPSQTN